MRASKQILRYIDTFLWIDSNLSCVMRVYIYLYHCLFIILFNVSRASLVYYLLFIISPCKLEEEEEK